MRKFSVLALSLWLAVLSLAVSAAQAPPARDLQIVTGEHWMSASLQEKRAFLFGIGNVLEIEQAMAGDSYDSMRGRSIVPVLLEGLSGMPIADIVIELNAFYAANPDQITRPVLEVLYLEMALMRIGS